LLNTVHCNHLIPTPPTEMTVNDEVWKKM